MLTRNFPGRAGNFSRVCVKVNDMAGSSKVLEPLKMQATKPGCGRCRDHEPIGFAFEFAYQPIVDVTQRKVCGHEALVRGPAGESAHSVLSRVNEDNRYRFDQACRVKAIETAAKLDLQGYLSINFMPNAVYEPAACIRTTLVAADMFGFPLERIMFEVTEGEVITERQHLIAILREYQRFGFRTAIDDFGAGYAGLTLLADFQPDIVKLDQALLRGIDHHPVKQKIVASLVELGKQLNVTILAEGVETKPERDFLQHLGITLMQGYWFAKPAFQSAGTVHDDAWI